MTFHPWARVCRSPRGVAAMLAVVLALVFFALADEAHERELFDADHAVHDAVQGWRKPALEQPIRALSDMGSGKVLVPLTLGVTAVLWWCRYRDALLVPVSGIASVVLEGLTKWLVNRPRPKNVGYGFPSGHVMGAVVVFGLLIYVVWKLRMHRGWSCLATTIGVAVVLGVAFSRIYLNAHWLSDVLGAGAGGTALLIAIVLAHGSRFCERVTGPRPSRCPRTRV